LSIASGLFFPGHSDSRIKVRMFTPSEAGAFACVYAVVIGVVVYKQFSWKGMLQTLENTVVDVGMVITYRFVRRPSVTGLSGSIPQKMAEFMLGISNVPWMVMLIIIVFLLIAGRRWTPLC